MPSELTKSDYQQLLVEISSIYTNSRQQAEKALNKLRVAAYWEIGKRIVKVEQKNNLRATYGEKLIQNLSDDLTAQHGNGFSTTNLKYMRQFYRAYPIGQTSDQLAWSVYQVLSTIKENNIREEYTEKCAKKGWSVRDLKVNLKEKGVETEGISRPRLEAPEEAVPAKLKASQGILYTYRLEFAPEALTLLPGDESRSGAYLIDLGFSVKRDTATSGLQILKDQMMVESSSGKGGYALKESEQKASALYTYKAYLEKIVDGDTLKCLIDLGFECWTSQRLRLRGIDCPELSTQKGQQVKSFLERELKGKDLIIKTHKDQTDKWDRYLVDVWSGQDYLNQTLIDKGLAEIYK